MLMSALIVGAILLTLRLARSDLPLSDIAGPWILSFLPIAAAYHIAHYLVALLQGAPIADQDRLPAAPHRDRRQPTGAGTNAPPQAALKRSTTPAASTAARSRSCSRMTHRPQARRGSGGQADPVRVAT
jgi:hypothetical protein